MKGLPIQEVEVLNNDYNIANAGEALTESNIESSIRALQRYTSDQQRFNQLFTNSGTGFSDGLSGIISSSPSQQQFDSSYVRETISIGYNIYREDSQG